MRFMWLILALAIFVDSATGAEQPRRMIALTIDDAPRPDTIHLSGRERATRLIAALKASHVPKVMFFSNTGRLVPYDFERMKLYAAAGHSIGNHSHTHPDLHRVGVEEFLANLKTADEILQTLPGYTKWFRFPYLREGKTVGERNAVRAALKGIGYNSAYVTVDTYDWYMDSLLQEALKTGKAVDFDRLGKAYVDLMSESIEFYDQVAQQTLGRSPKHVLLMHENDLAALFIDDLVGRLRSNGWDIISAEEAFTDPIAASEPDTLVLGQGRVIALAIDAGYAGQTRMWEDEAKIRAEFERRKVWQ
jgi:peptidoglycan-N-acetylglucosamine deacetylase